MFTSDVITKMRFFFLIKILNWPCLFVAWPASDNIETKKGIAGTWPVVFKYPNCHIDTTKTSCDCIEKLFNTTESLFNIKF